MEDVSHALENQIGSCRELLDVFKRERQVCLENDAISQAEVAEMLQAKLRLLNMFDAQKELLRNAAASNAGVQDEGQKELLRELGGLLEQLLIIDQENELLLRKYLAPGTGPASAPRTTSSVRRNTPATTSRLPAASRPPRTVTAPVRRPTAPARTRAADYRVQSMNVSSARSSLAAKYV